MELLMQINVLQPLQTVDKSKQLGKTSARIVPLKTFVLAMPTVGPGSVAEKANVECCLVLVWERIKVLDWILWTCHHDFASHPRDFPDLRIRIVSWRFSSFARWTIDRRYRT